MASLLKGSAWTTLVLFVLLAAVTMMLPMPDASAGVTIPYALYVKIIAAVLNIVFGLIGFLFLFSNAEMILLRLDTEESTRQGAAAMVAIARRMGMTL